MKENQKQTQDLIAKHGGNASGGRKPKYLLSGLMKCSECGSNFIVNDKYAYTCSAFKTGGSEACSNGIRVNRKVAGGVDTLPCAAADFVVAVVDRIVDVFEAAKGVVAVGGGVIGVAAWLTISSYRVPAG